MQKQNIQDNLESNNKDPITSGTRSFLMRTDTLAKSSEKKSYYFLPLRQFFKLGQHTNWNDNLAKSNMHFVY